MMKEKDKKIAVVLTLFCLSVFLTGLFVQGMWAVDIGASALSVGIPYVEGLYGTRTASDHYHMGLVTLFVVFCGVLMMVGYSIILWVFK